MRVPLLKNSSTQGLPIGYVFIDDKKIGKKLLNGKLTIKGSYKVRDLIKKDHKIKWKGVELLNFFCDIHENETEDTETANPLVDVRLRNEN